MELHADLEALSADLFTGAVIVDPDRMSGYRWDRANDPDAGLPAAVVRVSSTADVQKVMRIASRHGMPVVVRGAGSGLSGGSSAIDGCIVISTERMRTIEVDPATRTAVVEAGALTIEVKRAAEAFDLWYPPDPSSFEICSIGGNVATNAGGLCCLKYGVTSDYVLGLTVVLADGTAVDIGGPRLKDAAGYSLTKLFVGSEGTLGVVTRIVLRLLPTQRAAHTLVATFPTLASATDSVLAISRALRPSMLEFMDRSSINAVEDMINMGLDRGAAAMLIVQSDEAGAAAAADIARISDFCAANMASEVVATDDPTDGEAFVTARRLAIPAVERKGPLLLDDVGVPVPQLGALVAGIADIASTREIVIAVVAHAGDGNAHPLIVHHPEVPGESGRAYQAYGEVMNLAMRLGGTITGEHGVGRLKKAWLPGYLGEPAMALNRRIKQALDPEGLLGPGVVF